MPAMQDRFQRRRRAMTVILNLLMSALSTMALAVSPAYAGEVFEQD
jgi:hypothetical protein